MRRLPYDIPDFGLVVVGSAPQVSLFTPAWQCVNSYLLTDPMPKRRKNRPRPGLAGEYGGKSTPGIRSVELEISLIGDYDMNGNPTADPIVGEETNWRYLVDNVYEQAEDAQGRLAVGVTSAIPGFVYLGYLQVQDFRREPIQGTCCCYLEVTLPSGGLILTEV